MPIAFVIFTYLSTWPRSISRNSSGDLLRDRLGAVGVHRGLELGRRDDRDDLLVQAIDDGLRHVGRAHDAEPQRRLEAGIALLGDRRHVGQRGRARRGADRERAHLVRLGVLQQRRHRAEHGLHFARENRRVGRRVALVGNVHEVDLGGVLQHLHRQVRRGAVAGRGVVQLAGLALRERDELGQVARLHLRIDDQQVRRDRHQRDRREIRDRVVRKLRIRAGRDRVGAGRAERQRVAVGRRLGRGVGADRAAGARPVLDDHGLAEPLAQPLRHDAGDDVGRAARREADDELDGLVRIIGLRQCRASAIREFRRKRRMPAMMFAILLICSSSGIESADSLNPAGKF